MAGVLALAVLAGPAPAGAALGLTLSTPPPPLALKAGTTASSTGVVAVAADALSPTWSLSVSDVTGNAGRLAKGLGTCTGVEAQTANQLRVRATGSVGTTTSTGTQTVGASQVKIAGGTVLDPAVSILFTLAVNSNEILGSACTMQTTITYTLQ